VCRISLIAIKRTNSKHMQPMRHCAPSFRRELPSVPKKPRTKTSRDLQHHFSLRRSSMPAILASRLLPTMQFHPETLTIRACNHYELSGSLEGRPRARERFRWSKYKACMYSSSLEGNTKRIETVQTLRAPNTSGFLGRRSSNR
jgi:hypothetical protein